MVKLSILLASLLAISASASFCGAKLPENFRTFAGKFAAKDALDFPDQLNAAGTALKLPVAAHSGSTVPATLFKRLSWTPPKKKWINIKTYVHVVAASKKYEDGWVSDKAILKQLLTLNIDFAPSYIRFLPAGIDRTVNASWATWEESYSQEELEMRQALRKGDYKSLNIYILKELPKGNAGGSQFPIENPALVTPGSDLFYYDHVTVKYNTLPGGKFPYNLGKTLVHEAGHWMYLAHVFQDKNCTAPGDLVADTPAQSIPTGNGDYVSVGCPVGKDTCPNQPGLDSVKNYMDYTDDACLTEFTPLQGKRMHEQWALFRGAYA